jgi:hypothetical protein
MVTSSKAASQTAADNVADGLSGDIADFMRALRALVDPYRPEQHYMRGPGPKWRAKHDAHDAIDTVDAGAVPALVRVKA